MARGDAMTKFTQHVEDYLRLRRSLGYKLHDHARLLRRFAAHLDLVGAEFVTIELALAWALEPDVPAESVVPWMRLLVVRGFARYMAGIDPRTEIPPTGLIRFRQRRRPPFIYSDAEIVALMAQARTGIRQALVAATYETLIGLLAATGMRISEAIKLDRTDIDWAEAVLLVRESKFNKSRYVPLHDSTLEALVRLRAPARSSSARIHSTRASSCRCAEQGSTRVPSRRRSDASASTQAWGLTRRFRPGCTTSGTRWPSRRCSVGIATASTSSRACLPSPRIWGIATPPTPTTTSQQPRSSWPVPPACSTPLRRRTHDPDRPNPAGVLQ